MRVQALLAAAALLAESGIAQPTNHHAHSHRLKLRDIVKKRDWIAEKNWHDVDYTEAMKKVFPGSNPTVPESPSGSAAAAASTQQTDAPPTQEKAKTESKAESKVVSEEESTESSGSGNCIAVSGSSKTKRAELAQDLYAGDYTNNITPEKNCKSSGDYSLTFVNDSGEKIGVWLWNKMSPSGAMNGAMTDPTFDFELGKGEKTTFSFSKNSLYGFSKAVPRSGTSNMPLANIGEGSFEDESPHNNQGKSLGLSFYDVSLVSYDEQLDQGAQLVPMSIKAPNYDASTHEECNYRKGDNSAPPGCALGPHKKQPFHVTATFL